MFSLIYVFPLIFISFFESYWEAVNNILVPLNYYLWENVKKNMDLSLNEGGKNVNEAVAIWLGWLGFGRKGTLQNSCAVIMEVWVETSCDAAKE